MFLEAACILASGLAAAGWQAFHEGAAAQAGGRLLPDGFAVIAAALLAPFILPSLKHRLRRGDNGEAGPRRTSTLMALLPSGGGAARTALAVAALCGGCSQLAAVVAAGALTTTIGMALWILLALVGIAAIRVCAVIVVEWLERLERASESIVILGADDMVAQVARAFCGRCPRARSIHVIPDSRVTGANPEALPAAVRELAAAALADFPDRVIVATQGVASAATSDLLKTFRCRDVQVDLAMRGVPGLPPPGAERVDDEVFLLCLARRSFEGRALVMKLLLDKIVAAALLVFLAPLMLLAAIAIRIETPGPVIFRQTRHGWNGTRFEILKFRTMAWQGPAVGDGSRQTTRDDGRVTGIGRLLRRTSIDELPQLLNVLRGEMSLVGPRPLPVAMRTNGRLGEEIMREYPQRHRAPPGITGLAQVSGCRGPIRTDDELRRRINADLLYINCWSILLDLRILLMTPLRVIFSQDNAF